MIKAVIFDMDGVLIDSQPDYFYADMKTIERCGVSVDMQFTEQYAGLCNEDRWARYIKDLSLDKEIEALIQINMDIYYERINSCGITAVASVSTLVQKLIDRGILLAVASSSPLEMIQMVVEKIGLKDYFTVLVSGEQMKRSKPDPEIFIKAADNLNCNKNECIIIEDSAIGIMAACNAGIKCIGYKNPNSGNQDLSKAERIIRNFSELIDNNDWLENLG